MSSTDVIIDQWSGFDHKTGASGESLGLPTWIDNDEDKRRNRSYAIAAAYHESVARLMLKESSSKKKDWREQGEAAAITGRHAYAVIGDDLTIRVNGADEDLPDVPSIKPEPVEVSGDSPSGVKVSKRRFEAQMRIWESTAMEIIEAWEEAQELQPRLRARQTYLRRWAKANRWEGLIREEQSEMVVPLGDGISVYAVEAGHGPLKELWDPGSYFPVFEDGNIVEYPDKIHLAYEFEDDDGKRLIRRVTFELVDLEEIYEGSPTQVLPYAVAEPATRTCIKTDAYFKLDGSSEGLGNPVRYGQIVDPETDEEVDIKELDLMIDFIPIVHKPRTMSSRTHFGRPFHVRLAQLLDEIANADTDTARASALNGSPPMVAANLQVAPQGKDGKTQAVNLGPGRILNGGRDAKLSPLMMSDNLRASTEYGELLRDRLSGNSATPKGLLGRPVDAMNSASGVAWEMSFTPFIQEVMMARLALAPKLDLEMEIVQKLAIVADDPALGGDHTVYESFVEFGSFMPSDLASLVKMIVDLASQGMMEPRLCARLLEGAGMEVGDVEQLVDAINARDTVRALDLAELLGKKYAAQFLGAPEPEDDDPDAVDDANPPAPVIDLGAIE